MLKKLICAVVFIVSMVLVVKGNLIEGYTGLLTMMIGLIGILSELHLYSKKYQ